MSPRTDEQGYNGWFNYETWALALWMGNDQGSYLFWQENAKEAIAEVLNESSELRHDKQELVNKASYRLSQQISSYVEEENPLKDQASAFADLLNAALAEVNYKEIAEHLLEEDLIDSALQEWNCDNPSEDEEDE